MKIKVKKIKGLQLLAENEKGHKIVMDTKKEVGGFESSMTPMELVLAALGGCTAMDVISILDKMRLDYEEFFIEVKGERKNEHPRVYKKVELTYNFKGKNLDIKKIEKAIELSLNKYCSVSNMINKTAQIRYNIKINE